MSELSIFRGVDFTGTDWAERNIDIASRLECDPGLVSAARKHFGMQLKERADWTGVDWSKKNAEIAEELGVSHSAVVKQRAAMGLSRERVDYSEVDWTLPNAELVRQLGVSFASVAAARKKYTGEVRTTRGRQAFDGLQKISVAFPADEFALLEAAAEERGTTKAKLLREALREYLKSSGSAEKSTPV